MKRVVRSDILSLGEYEAARPRIQKRIFAVKDRRRVLLPPHLALLFENRETVLYQIHEMVRAERIVKAAAIAHEIRTYNDLLPRAGELRGTLFIEIPDLHKRRQELDKFVGLPAGDRLWIETGGRRIDARFDEQQYSDSRVAAVQYLTFPVGTRAAADLAAGAALVCDHPANRARVALPPSLRKELVLDLTGAVPKRRG